MPTPPVCPTVVAMPLRRRMPAVALALLVTVALAACTTPSPSPTPTKRAAHTPLFASDAEALDAATKAYAEYQSKTDQIAHDGGTDPERIRRFVTANQWTRERKGFEVFASAQRRTEGSSSFDTASLAHYDKSTGTIEVFLCEDVGKTRVLDAKGTNVTPSQRQTRIPKDVQFVTAGDNNDLLISRSDVWSGDDFC